MIRTSVILSLVGLCLAYSSAVQADSKPKQRESIMVHHEWGKLKEVVVGFPYFRFPKEVPAFALNFLPKSAIAYAEKNLGKNLEDADPETYKRFVQQVNAIIKILRDRGVAVHQVKRFQPNEEKYLADLEYMATQAFARDTILVIGNTCIETAMNSPGRRRERFAIRRTLGDRLYDGNARIVAMPEPQPFPADKNGKYGPGPFLEGGDVFLLGYDIYVGNSGNGSNKAGIRWLQNCLGQKYRVHEVPLRKKFLHLDCVLATPRSGLAIICKEGFPDGIPEFLKGWKLIEVSADDAEKKLGCNGLVLDDKTMIVGEDMPDLAKALRAEGIKVITTPIDAIYWQGGGFRCWHHPLVRESKLE